MVANKAGYIGKRLKVEEIEKLFPDKYAILKDCTDTIGNIVVDGILVEVLDFKDMLDYMKIHAGEDLYEFRTTDDGMNVGYIHGELVKNQNLG